MYAAAVLFMQELADAKALNGEKKQELAEAGAKCGELTSELQQKGSTVEACRVSKNGPGLFGQHQASPGSVRNIVAVQYIGSTTWYPMVPARYLSQEKKCSMSMRYHGQTSQHINMLCM